jgi:hypothetical protein
MRVGQLNNPRTVFIGTHSAVLWMYLFMAAGVKVYYAHGQIAICGLS